MRKRWASPTALPALVHEGCGLQQHDALAAEARLRGLALEAAAPRAEVVALGDAVERHEADVVAVARVLGPGFPSPTKSFMGEAPRESERARAQGRAPG